MTVKQTKTNLGSFIVIGVLIMAIALIGSSSPGLPMMLDLTLGQDVYSSI
jgi:hypothetical protein